MNRYSPGAVCGFLFDTVCGIQVLSENSFLIEPWPGGSLTEAYAEYASPYGLICSGWKKEENRIQYEVSVPANTTAILRVNNETEQELTAGKHRITVIPAHEINFQTVS